MKKQIIDLAIESWRLSRFTEELIEDRDIIDQEKLNRKVLWFNDKLENILETLNIKLVNLEECKFDIGMPVKAINIEEFKDCEALKIKKMLEPVVMCGDSLERTGTVLLAII